MSNYLNIETAVKLVGQLPNLLLKDIAFDNPNQEKVVKTYKYFYQGLELWLEHFVLHKSLVPEAFLTDWKHFQAHAQLDTALLHLATGLHPRNPWLQEVYSEENGPTLLWFHAIGSKCENTFKESGLLGKPCLVGKDDFHKNNLTLLDRLSEHSIRVYLPEQIVNTPITDEVQFTDCPVTYLAVLASHLAGYDEDFDKDYWQPYEKVTRRCTRKIRSNPKLQGGVLLPNGELFLTDHNKKIPAAVRKPKGKGFGSRK
jgi:hypothetical protein